jgi:crotonobetainyl-CoA:carnitine CoA-transferase CaiB-like acyl-CoA transferase
MSLIDEVWEGIGGDPGVLARLQAEPRPTGALPSSFAVESLGAAAFAAVGLAVAELTGASSVRLDAAGIAAALRSEQSVRVGDEPPESVWDPLSRVYEAADGWVRLHGNYAQHRAALERVFGTTDPDAVGARILVHAAAEIERLVIEAGGAAAATRTLDQWSKHAHGSQVTARPLVETVLRDDGTSAPWRHRSDINDRPLAGLRVLELTRVIAGPVAGRTLSWFGADVLRIESPFHEELRTIVVDTGPDKRSATLDLRDAAARDQLAQLIAGADVVLHGLRPGALDSLGFDAARRAALRPGLIDALHSAYGPGPWLERRGFDSLMQLSTGLALAEARAAMPAPAAGTKPGRAGGPRPLPCQILDHATGLLLAAAVVNAVQARAGDGRGRTVTASLARTAATLAAAPRDIPLLPSSPPPARPGTLSLHGPFGTTHHVPLPVEVEGFWAGWLTGPPMVGQDEPAWR